MWVASLDGALVVSWERAGHTCVLASRTATLPQMLRFVAGATRRSRWAGPAAPAPHQLTTSVPSMPSASWLPTGQ